MMGINEATDALYDTTPRALAARFGVRAIELLRQGREVRATARLAATFAFQVNPTLRDGYRAPVANIADHLWRLGTELNADAADRLARKR